MGRARETFHSREALDNRAQELLDGRPDFVFTAAGLVDVLRDLGHLPFNRGVPEQPPGDTEMDRLVQALTNEEAS